MDMVTLLTDYHVGRSSRSVSSSLFRLSSLSVRLSLNFFPALSLSSLCFLVPNPVLSNYYKGSLSFFPFNLHVL
jgi:hypothetical protein